MTEMNLNAVATSDMTSSIGNSSLPSVNLDSPTGQKEQEYINTNANKYWGFYKKNHNFKKAIDALATWTVGKGFVSSDIRTDIVLKDMIGWGEDTFESIAWNLFVTKKVCGDAFAEIIRNENGTLLNIKPLNPANIKIVVNENGIIQRYEQINKIGTKEIKIKFIPREILHLCNDRVADEIHGTSVAEVCEWVIDTIHEIQDNYRIAIRRNIYPFRVISVNTDNEAKIEALRVKYEKMIKLGDVMFAPEEVVKVSTDGGVANAILNPMPYLNYLDNLFYRAVGVPKIVIGGSEEFTEATAKIAYLTFEQVYSREQKEFEADLWNQLGLKITLNKPASLQNELLSDNAKDANSMAITKPSEMTPNMRQE
jgi:hypothetical protein